jgi:hypothetical protein
MSRLARTHVVRVAGAPNELLRFVSLLARSGMFACRR